MWGLSIEVVGLVNERNACLGTFVFTLFTYVRDIWLYLMMRCVAS